MSASASNACRLPDLTRICRLCLAEELGTISIFNSDSKTNVPLQIMACTALELHATDALPKQICRDCRIQLERSYYFRKRSQISDTKLRKHIRLINAGKKSRVFEPKAEDDDDDDDEDDELKESQNFLKQIEEEEREKQQQHQAEIEDTIRQKLREEEMNTIFEEAKNFFISKISNKTSRKLVDKKEPPVQDEPSASASASSEEKSSEKSNPIFDDVVNSTEVPCSENADDEEINKDTCYVVKMENVNETAYEIQENRQIDNETDDLTFTVVKVQVERPKGGNFGSLSFKESTDSNEVEIDQNSDADEYNEQQVAYLEEISNSSAHHIFTIDSLSETEQDRDQQNDEMAIDLVREEDDDDEEEEEEEECSDQLEDEAEKPKYNQGKAEEYLVEEMQIVESDEPKASQNDRLDLIEVNNPQNPEELKIFKCPHCPHAFTRRAQLARHASVHKKVRGFQCEHCRKWFACKSSLDRHRRIHTGEKPFQCEICLRRFIQKEILKRHLAIHTGERPFPCPHCNKSFVQRQMLASHINLKHTDNPVIQMHECFLCPKSFCHASGLSRHLLTHSGVTYTCKKCGKKFSDKSAVKRHTSSVHS